MHHTTCTTDITFVNPVSTQVCQVIKFSFVASLQYYIFLHIKALVIM